MAFVRFFGCGFCTFFRLRFPNPRYIDADGDGVLAFYRPSKQGFWPNYSRLSILISYLTPQPAFFPNTFRLILDDIPLFLQKEKEKGKKVNIISIKIEKNICIK